MLWLFAILSLFGEPSAKFTFEADSIGRLPKDWQAAKTGDGAGSRWEVRDDESAKGGRRVLAQVSSEGPRPLFNLCVATKTKAADVDLSVNVRAVEGKIDRGGGPVWRFRDANNYYIARWNPLEDNFRVYKVVAGKREQLATADVKLSPDAWHTVRVIHAGDHLRCFLDGKLHLEVRDSTFGEAGHIGLWTKADAVTYFDELALSPPRPE